jgi:hypothetical protein
MKNIGTTIFATLCLCAAAPWAYAQSPAAFVAAQAPAAQLAQCMKMPMASPQQKSCIAAVQQALAAMRAPPAPPPARAPVIAAKVPDAPPEVKKAAQQLGLAGLPPAATPGAPVVTAPPIANISGMDPQMALLILQQQQANLMRAQTTAHLSDVQARATKMQEMQDAAARLKSAASTQMAAATMAGAMMTIGSGIAGAQAIASMKNAGLDTSKTVVKTVSGQAQYQASAAQMDAYKAQLDAMMSKLGTEQQRQAETMQSMMAMNQQLTDIVASYINSMNTQRAMAIGNMH